MSTSAAVRSDGLTTTEVAERVARGEVNDVPVTPSRTVAQIVRANVFTRFNALLGGLLAVILIVGPLQDALFGLVLIANASIGIVQELRAKRTLDRLALLSAPKATVVREGMAVDRGVGEVVLDDVLELTLGDQVVVDGEIFTAAELEIDESLLTGESDPVAKGPGEEVLSGSFVVAGTGRYRATRVGRDAYAAKIAEDAKRFTLARSELQAGINQILRIVTWLLIPTAAILAYSQYRNNPNLHDAIRGSVAATVAMIPEGLVLLTSLAFAVGVLRLARRNVLVQELPAVEILARVDVLCIDKTGTLTQGRLAVQGIETLGKEAPVARALASLVATDAHPNATLAAIRDAGANLPDLPHPWAPIEVVAFSSDRKWSGASFEGQGTWVLGAPDVVLPDAPSDAEIRVRVRAHADAGERVVLLARSARGFTQEALPDDLEPVALVVIGDEIRPTTAATLAYFRHQNVAVKVISGDDPATVAAIARRVQADGADHPVNARELPDDPDALAAALEEASIFGRVTPQQKREMVDALRSAGHVVAMTGDGVNDALALKDADIGIAMGSGSEATRAVAQVVLLDSSFDAMPQVVGEGRRVLGNIERTSNLYVTKTVYALLLALAVGVAGLAFPFLPRHLTLVGAFTIGIPSFFLALAPNDERARPGFLRRVLRFSIPCGVLAATATYLAYTVASNEPGVSLAEARTTATMVLCFVGLLILSIIASPLRGWRLWLVFGMAGGFVAVLVTPFLARFFALAEPPLIVWLAGFGIAAIVWFFARLFVPESRPIGPGERQMSVQEPGPRRGPDLDERPPDDLAHRDEPQAEP